MKLFLYKKKIHYCYNALLNFLFQDLKMNFLRVFFVIFFFIPNVLSSLTFEEAYSIYPKVGEEWKKHDQLIRQFNALRANEKDRGQQLLNESIACCFRANAHCDAILNDVEYRNGINKKDPWKKWWKELRANCQNDKNNIDTEIKSIQDAIYQIQAEHALSKTKNLYQKSVETADLAAVKIRNFQRRLNNIEAVVLILKEIALLYEEASQISQEALSLISSYNFKDYSNFLSQTVNTYRELADKYKKEAIDWPDSVATQKSALKDQIARLKEDSALFKNKGLKRNCYELQKLETSILEEVIECCSGEEAESYKNELIQLKEEISFFEKESDLNHLTNNVSLITADEYKAREKSRKDFFFKNQFQLNPELYLPQVLNNAPLPRAIPLDGFINRQGKDYQLYTEQFYRFLIQNKDWVSEIFIQVYEQDKIVHTEKITIPLKNTLDWDHYLRDGMILIPESRLKSEFGLDLRLIIAYDLKNQFSIIVAQKNTNPTYRFSFSLEPEKPLYGCCYSPPPPWQLEALRKPTQLKPTKTLKQNPSPEIVFNIKDEHQSGLENWSFPLLDQFVEELQKDPLDLASYVQNEIGFIDQYLYQENDIYLAPAVHRNPLTTFLEKQGSPWEQCQLLVYLLRRAGCQAYYAIGDFCTLPKDYAERLLSTEITSDHNEALMKYPWVIFFDGNKWISLFPWMKEIQVQEGYDLYSFLPEEYATANRWILRYLKGDEEILKHIGPDGDDSAGVLFVRFLEENLRREGQSLSDTGKQRVQIKREFSSWQDFPHPAIPSHPEILASIKTQDYAVAKIEIVSCQNPNRLVQHIVPLACLNYGISTIQFISRGNNQHTLQLQIAGSKKQLNVDETDQLFDVTILWECPLGSKFSSRSQTFTIVKGTNAALCSNLGGANAKMISHYYDQFLTEKDEEKRFFALLEFIGMSYFEKCSQVENKLAVLHGINPLTVFAFGLSKLSPNPSKLGLEGQEESVLPQVDMFWFYSGNNEQRLSNAQMQCLSLVGVDSSSNEHQILREIFKDEHALSTVKLLQLAHKQQQKKDDNSEGFLRFTTSIFEAAEKTPEAAQSLFFHHLKNLNLREVKDIARGQWVVLKNALENENSLSPWSYAYMTPGLTSSQKGSYKEMGTLVISPTAHYCLISNNNITLNGGLGSPISSRYLTAQAIREWQLVPAGNQHLSRYTLQLPGKLTVGNTNAVPTSQFLTGTTKWVEDVRLGHKSWLNSVADPVDTVTGAFYIDELDLNLPGPFPLEIRRNYNSQNPIIGNLGCGWKLSLNPFLIEQEGKRFVAEPDGTIIVYSLNQETSRWVLLPEENPELFNFNPANGSTSNPFHAYIENDILYKPDGSRRFFEEGLLKKWVDAQGNTLIFSYEKGQLTRIESSNGSFCGFHYNHENKISEIYTKDGRRISYEYNSLGDLVHVTLPNSASITYEYDHAHRLIRETKPHGKVLENVYDDAGRVKEQRSPMGFKQGMVTTATFEYFDRMTTVTDACGGKTIYKIFGKQIYKVIDPLGHTSLQSFFIDEQSWFDPVTEQVQPWNQKGGVAKSLKSTTDKRGLTTYYLYDQRGNLREMGLRGKDLTGSGETTIAKNFFYNDRDLCIEERVNENRTHNIYDTNFPYLPTKIKKYCDDVLISYYQVAYNALGQIEKEDNSGAVIYWRYDQQGFPSQKVQITGNDDPDVVTSYKYNRQGQCIEIASPSLIQRNNYDLMGNQTESKLFSVGGKLLSANYVQYDLNNAPIWRQNANPQDELYIDYHASGLVKAKRQVLAPSHYVAFTLYEYDASGYLIEETDPRGFCTYREYDALGKIKSETKEGHTKCFTYEPGGLVEMITSPSGSQTVRSYTTNGLLKEEIYPDGTTNSITCDLTGRPVFILKNDMVWEINYDDKNHRTIRKHLKTQDLEFHEFDMRGNLIQVTDRGGFVTNKTYDGLNRIKTETTPTGRITNWKYEGDLVICIQPNGETVTNRFEGEHVVETTVHDQHGTLIAHSQFHFDPETGVEEILQGDVATVIWKNVFDLPIKVQKGDVVCTYDYDACGNCTASSDGDGRVTRLVYDGLCRVIQKELPDGSEIKYEYDLDSNLIKYQLPNGNIWRASYDSMQRKVSEELLAGQNLSGHWEYTYVKGYLTESIDPMRHKHTYLYDSDGNMTLDSVDGWRRVFNYDSRGLLVRAEQIKDSNKSWLFGWFNEAEGEQSRVERTYDPDGRLCLESIYLNSKLIQQTNQRWNLSGRSLLIGNHERNYSYQNNQLINVSGTQNTSLSYDYNLGGRLVQKNNALCNSEVFYNSSALPNVLHTHTPEGINDEILEWRPSGKLSSYSTAVKQIQYSYDNRGYLKEAGDEKYDFDFGRQGVGVRTIAPNWSIPQDGLDQLGRIKSIKAEKNTFETVYDQMGQMIMQGNKKFEWDPWARLIKVSDHSFTWKASYDALGRRLQTHYTQGWNSPIITTSFYDPEIEFEEIGVKIGDKTFWKFFGPNGCDAVQEEGGDTLYLMQNALGQLLGVVSSQGTRYCNKLPSAYGYQSSTPFIATDVYAYALSLSWQSKQQDPTGLIWLGERYYDPSSGIFISPDPVSFPVCMDLYSYANGDPINLMDPNGRFASHVYQTIEPVVFESFQIADRFQEAFNKIPAYCANSGHTNSCEYDVGSFDLAIGEIGFINGIDNSFFDSINSGLQLSRYAKGAKIHVTYNASHTSPIDAIECFLGLGGIHSPPVQMLKKRWNHFISKNPDERIKYLQNGHSGGNIHIKNALLTSPREVQQRIICVALAPGAIIPQQLCFRSYNYASKNDFVPYFDLYGNFRYRDQLQILKPHKDAKRHDHEFLSPTFKERIQYHLDQYINNNGRES